jgi:hypothetical protein
MLAALLEIQRSALLFRFFFFGKINDLSEASVITVRRVSGEAVNIYSLPAHPNFISREGLNVGCE